MSRSKIPHGGVVRCDMPNCDERFTTYSWLRLARSQAASQGWHRIRGGHVQDAEGYALASAGKKVDLCPEHGRVALDAIAKTKAEKAEAKKAGKAVKKAKAA